MPRHEKVAFCLRIISRSKIVSRGVVTFSNDLRVGLFNRAVLDRSQLYRICKVVVTPSGGKSIVRLGYFLYFDFATVVSDYAIFFG